MTKYFYIVILLNVFCQNAKAQTLDRNRLGLNCRFGLSESRDASTSSTLQTNNPLYLSAAEGLIYLIKMKPIQRNEVALLPYLRTELNLSGRSGLFNINNMLTRLSTTNIDLVVLAPISFKINESTFPYLGLGGNYSYNLNAWSPDGPSSIMPRSKAGLVADMGVSFFGERIMSFLGFRLMGEFGPYAFSEWGFYYSLAIKPKKKI